MRIVHTLGLRMHRNKCILLLGELHTCLGAKEEVISCRAFCMPSDGQLIPEYLVRQDFPSLSGRIGQRIPRRDACLAEALLRSLAFAILFV